MKEFDKFLDEASEGVLVGLETPIAGVPSVLIIDRDVAKRFVRIALKEVMKLTAHDAFRVREALKNG